MTIDTPEKVTVRRRHKAPENDTMLPPPPPSSDDGGEKKPPVAPKRRARTKAEREKAKTPPKGELTRMLTELYTLTGVMLSPFDAYCGEVIIQSGPGCAEKLEDLARQNDSVMRVLLALCQSSAWGAALAAHAPIVMAVAHHHTTLFSVPKQEESTQNSENEVWPE